MTPAILLVVLWCQNHPCSDLSWLFFCCFSSCDCKMAAPPLGMNEWMPACSVMSYSCDPMDCTPPGFSLWDCPGKSTGVGCHFLLKGIFSTRESNWGLLHWQADSLPLSHLGSPWWFMGKFKCQKLYFVWMLLFFLSHLYSITFQTVW